MYTVYYKQLYIHIIFNNNVVVTIIAVTALDFNANKFSGLPDTYNNKATSVELSLFHTDICVSLSKLLIYIISFDSSWIEISISSW